MSMTFSADPSGTFGTIAVNGIPQIEVHNDGSIKTPTGKLIGSAQGIVGTVSQSGGLPTGAIIERGSNANGNYIRFADGTMICQQYQAGLSQTFSNSYGDQYYGLMSLPFAASFIEMPSSSASVTDQAGAILDIQARPISISSMSLTLLCNFNATKTLNVSFTAIGRWF